MGEFTWTAAKEVITKSDGTMGTVFNGIYKVWTLMKGEVLMTPEELERMRGGVY